MGICLLLVENNFFSSSCDSVFILFITITILEILQINTLFKLVKKITKSSFFMQFDTLLCISQIANSV